MNSLIFSYKEEKNVNTMTEEIFHLVIDHLEYLYGPLIKAKGKTLEIRRFWEKGTVNPYIHQIDQTWKIFIFGGLARHQHNT